MVDTDRTADLDELMALLTDGSDDTYGYSAAWFDTTTHGRAARPGRAHPRLARHRSTSCPRSCAATR